MSMASDRNNLFDIPGTKQKGAAPQLKPTPDQVAEIYSTAGKAFSRLAELTARLHTPQDTDNSGNKASGVRWTAEEIQQLKDAVSRFSGDIDKISDQIKTRTVAQVKNMIRSENLAPKKRTNLFDESEFTKSPKKGRKSGAEPKERVRNTDFNEDADISPTAMLDQTAAENHQLTIY